MIVRCGIRAPDTLRDLRDLREFATIVVGAVHLQQYADFIADVPTIGVLFSLNGLVAGLAAILLATRHATSAGRVRDYRRHQTFCLV